MVWFQKNYFSTFNNSNKTENNNLWVGDSIWDFFFALKALNIKTVCFRLKEKRRIKNLKRMVTFKKKLETLNNHSDIDIAYILYMPINDKGIHRFILFIGLFENGAGKTKTSDIIKFVNNLMKPLNTFISTDNNIKNISIMIQFFIGYLYHYEHSKEFDINNILLKWSHKIIFNTFLKNINNIFLKIPDSWIKLNKFLDKKDLPEEIILTNKYKNFIKDCKGKHKLYTPDYFKYTKYFYLMYELQEIKKLENINWANYIKI